MTFAGLGFGQPCSVVCDQRFAFVVQCLDKLREQARWSVRWKRRMRIHEDLSVVWAGALRMQIERVDQVGGYRCRIRAIAPVDDRATQREDPAFGTCFVRKSEFRAKMSG